MELKKEERQKLLDSFKRFTNDIRKYDIINDIHIDIDIRFGNKNNRYDYIYIRANKNISALGEDFDDLIKHMEEDMTQTWYCSYRYEKALDIMYNKDKIFAELEKESNKDKEILNDILNY